VDTATLASLIGMVLVVGGSAAVNFWGAPAARSTSDFLVASRSVGPIANAAAISGEYLSAAAFLGIAGLVLRDGADALWYPVGFTAGYLALLLFVAAPLRRSGAYSVSDFADARMGDPLLRRLCTIATVVIGCLGLLPQLQGAGLTIATVTPLPSWAGAVGAAAVILVTMLFGGLRSMTLVQATQYFLKVLALAVPTVVLAVVFLSSSTVGEPPGPTFQRATTLTVRADVDLRVIDPTVVQAQGTVDGAPVDGPLTWAPGLHSVGTGTRITFPADASVPIAAHGNATGAADQQSWLSPQHRPADHPLLWTYSLLTALFLGTVGLPNLLGRFYTNADGRAARRTAAFALALVGGFSLIPVVLGALARYFTPQLLLTGNSDAAVLLLPSAALTGLGADLLTGLVAAGAWAAFLSAGTGLAVSVASVMHSDVFRRSGPGGFRVAAVIATAVPLVLALRLQRLDFADTVALAFAVAASTLCPFLVLGIWWRRLTARGAVAGLVVGGLASTGAVVATVAGVTLPGTLGILLHQPAAVSAPAAFVVMIVVSLATSAPADADSVLLQLHAPERLGLSRNSDAPGRP
jgi:Na+(H+)/acetate symporter ActP